MERINKLKDILQRKTKLNNSRYLEVNINEISNEIGCSMKEVLYMLNELCLQKDIKAVKQVGLGNDYMLTVLEKSTIWSDWHKK